MSQPLRDLRRLLAASQTLRGRAVALANGRLRVATADGVVEVPAETGVGVGDEVVLRNGRAIRFGSDVDAPIFWV